MEFLDEDARPRFVFQSRPIPSSSQANPQTNQNPLHKPFTLITLLISSVLLLLSFLFLQTEPFKSLLFWLSLSLLIGPFCPSNLTGGDIRVGCGPILEPLAQEPENLPEKTASKKRSKPIKYEEIGVESMQKVEIRNGLLSKGQKIEALVNSENGLSRKGQKSEALGSSENGLVSNEWSEEDIEILKKQMGKNPVGKARRWEVIAEAFNGRHRVESVIKKAKELGERKLDDSDSYARFLKNRKPVDARIQDEFEGKNSGESRKGNRGGGGDGGEGWSAAEDIALLNALKAFPKDVAMRWEKIAAAVPGMSKAACVKRVAELKRDFRSSKTGTES